MMKPGPEEDERARDEYSVLASMLLRFDAVAIPNDPAAILAENEENNDFERKITKTEETEKKKKETLLLGECEEDDDDVEKKKIILNKKEKNNSDPNHPDNCLEVQHTIAGWS